MAINPNRLTIENFKPGLVLNENPASMPPGALTEAKNVYIRDGKVQTRGAFKYDSSNFPVNLQSNTEDQILGFYHNRDFYIGVDHFWAFYHTDTTNIKMAKKNSSAWDVPLDVGVSVNASYDYWVNWAVAMEDTANDGTIDARYLLINVATTDPRDISNGATVKRLTEHASSPSIATVTNNLKCKRILNFNGQTLYLGIDDSLKVKWSHQYDHADLSAGTVGYTWLADTGGAIMNGAIMKGSVVCYKEDSIVLGTHQAADPYIRWETIFGDVGLLGTRLLAVLGDKHFFVGTNNIYMYTGGSGLTPIGDKIWTSFLSDLKEGGASATQLYKNRAFASVHRDQRHVLFWIPTTEAWPDKAYVLDTSSGGWTTFEPPRNGSTQAVFTGWGEYNHDSVVKSAEWIPVYGSMTAFGANVQPLVYDYDTYTDGTITADTSAIAISSHITTQDVSPQLREDTCWVRASFELKGKGGTDDVATTSYSTDAGVTFSTPVDTHSITNAQSTVHTTDDNVTAYKIRYKVACATAGDGFELNRLEIDPEMETEKQSYPYRGSGRGDLL